MNLGMLLAIISSRTVSNTSPLSSYIPTMSLFVNSDCRHFSFFFLSLHMHGFLKFPVYMAAFEHLNSQILIQFLFWVFHISEYLLWVCPLSHLCSNLCKMKSREPAHEMSPSHVKAEVRTALFPLAQGQHLWTRPLLKTKTSSTLGRI
jgi:hypothetical protein